MACGGVWRAGMGSTNASGTPARWLARCWYAPPTPCTRAGCAAAIASTSACVTGPSRKGCRTTRRTRCRCRHRDRRSASRIVPCASRRTSTAPVPSTKLVAATVGDPPDHTRFLSPVRRADADSDHSQGRTLEHNTARNAKHATAGHDRARPLPCGYRDRPGGGGPVLRPPRAEDDERGRRRRLRWSLRARSVMHASHRGDFRRRPYRLSRDTEEPRRGKADAVLPSRCGPVGPGPRIPRNDRARASLTGDSDARATENRSRTKRIHRNS
jgi:hypothetical protein